MSTSWTTNADDLPSDKGAYLLWITLPEPAHLPPRFKNTQLPPGHYLYLGSANGPGGIRARCARHLKRHKKCHWQVDWVTNVAQNIHVLAVPAGHECNLTKRLLIHRDLSVTLPNFGSSDCSTCPAHFLRVGGRASLSSLKRWIENHPREASSDVKVQE